MGIVMIQFGGEGFDVASYRTQGAGAFTGHSASVALEVGYSNKKKLEYIEGLALDVGSNVNLPVGILPLTAGFESTIFPSGGLGATGSLGWG